MPTDLKINYIKCSIYLAVISVNRGLQQFRMMWWGEINVLSYSCS